VLSFRAITVKRRANLARIYDGHVYILIAKSFPHPYVGIEKIFPGYPHSLSSPAWFPLYPFLISWSTWPRATRR